MDNINIITGVLIALNVLVSYKGFNDYNFFDRYKIFISPILNGDKIRLLSSGFLHVDTSHLLFNMLTLYFFADTVISYIGVFGFLAVYFGSLIIGNLLTLYFKKNQLNYTAVGASGAVTGVLYAAILLQPDMKLLFFFIPIPIPAYVFGIGYLLYSIYGMKTQLGNIGHDAHFGGAVAGFIITLLLVPSLVQTSSLMLILLSIPIVILFILKKLNKI